MRTVLSRLWLLATLLLCPTLCPTLWAVEPAAPGISVIMASGAVQPKITREELALIFEKKKRFWDDGQRIQAVNLSATNALRRAFSMQIYGQSPEELDDYWRDMYFHGVLPPYVLASEEAVIRFVASTPGAIGYISRCLTDHRVSVIMRLDAGSACTR